MPVLRVEPIQYQAHGFAEPVPDDLLALRCAPCYKVCSLQGFRDYDITQVALYPSVFLVKFQGENKHPHLLLRN